MRAINRRSGYRSVYDEITKRATEASEFIDNASSIVMALEAKRSEVAGYVHPCCWPRLSRPGREQLSRPVSSIARGRVLRLTARRLEIRTRELGSPAQRGTGLAAMVGDGRHRGRSFRSSRSAGKPCTRRREAGREDKFALRRSDLWTRITRQKKPGYSAFSASSINKARRILTKYGGTCGVGLPTCA